MSEVIRPVIYPYSSIAAANLRANRDALANRTGKPAEYTPPAPGHYWGLYLWDQALHSIIDARHGSQQSLEAAPAGILTMMRGQHEDGFIPNHQELGPRRKIEPERWLGYEEDEHSNYLQPPILALAVSETFFALIAGGQADKAEDFLRQTYPGLKHFYEYIDKHRRLSDDDRRMFITHPHESGRDSDPTFDYIKPHRRQQQGPIVSKTNMVLDYFDIIHFSNKLRRAGGDLEAARELFGAVDVMMNCMLVDNLSEMASLARGLNLADDEFYFSQYALEVEEKVLTDMWVYSKHGEEGGFFAQDNQGTPINEVSVSNLFPLVLDGLKEYQLEKTLNLMDRSFNTTYPLPSVATDSPSYDPHYREPERLWRGPVWQNINWYIVERGLKKQRWQAELIERPDLSERCQYWVRRLKLSSHSLLKHSGPREFYDPSTGKGLRRRVKNFGWSNLGYVL